MEKQKNIARIKELGLLAVIRGPSPELTIKMVDALIVGGVLGIEITYTTPNAIEVVKTLAKKYGSNILLGMGTLTEPGQAAEAQLAGSRFLVSPVCNEGLTEAMVETGLVVMVGALTPTEIAHAYQMGSDIVKVFPGALVGPSYIRNIHGPFPYIPLMPTGGVNISNVADWFAAGVVAVGAGSTLCPPSLAKAGRFGDITDRAIEFVQAVKSAREG